MKNLTFALVFSVSLQSATTDSSSPTHRLSKSKQQHSDPIHDVVNHPRTFWIHSKTILHKYVWNQNRAHAHTKLMLGNIYGMISSFIRKSYEFLQENIVVQIDDVF